MQSPHRADVNQGAQPAQRRLCARRSLDGLEADEYAAAWVGVWQGGWRPVTTAIISSASALLGALGVVFITQRYTVALERERRSEARRDEYRRVMSELLAAGFAKVALYRPSIPIFAEYKDASRERWLNLLTLEGDERLVRTNIEFQRAAARAAMLAGDQEMINRLAAVRRLDAAFTEDVINVAMSGGVEAAQAGLEKLRNALKEVEAAATSGVLHVAADPPRSFWPWPGRRKRPLDPT